jgi:hypothetical protein
LERGVLAHAEVVSGEPFPSRGEPYDALLVEQYAEYRSVDVDVAERLLRFQGAAVEALGTFEDALGRDFAGMWVNEERPDMVRVVRHTPFANGTPSGDERSHERP